MITLNHLGEEIKHQHIFFEFENYLGIFFSFLKKFFYCYSITVVCIFSPSLHSPPWFCPCVLSSSSCNPLSSLSPPHFPLAIVRLFLTSVSLAKHWKQPKCPWANEWIKKLWYIYTMEFYAAERKKKLIPFCNSMDGTGEHYANWNQPGSGGTNTIWSHL